MSEHREEVDRLIQQAADGRALLADELALTLRHIASAGFDPWARETARGPLRGQIWAGQVLTASTRISADVRHWLLHVRVNREWPASTTLRGYIESLSAVIVDQDSGVFINTYQGEMSVGVIRRSRDLCGS